MADDEARDAFGDPGARLGRLSHGERPPDRISLTDHVVEAEIGAFESERGVTQRLAFDVAVEVAPVEAGDDVDRILSYDRIAEAIDRAMAADRVSLLETLAEAVANRLFYEPQVLRVLIRIRKLDRGPGALGVEIVRGRAEVDYWAAEKPLDPRLFVLGDRLASGKSFPAVLDRLLDGPGSVLLVAPPVALPSRARRAASWEAQSRINLLAADQGAWLLAGRDKRLSVVSSLTEIDWHLRHYQRPAVWAPSKVSLDEHWGGMDHLGRALFLGARLGAREAVTLGIEIGGLMEAPLRVRSGSLRHPYG